MSDFDALDRPIRTEVLADGGAIYETQYSFDPRLTVTIEHRHTPGKPAREKFATVTTSDAFGRVTSSTVSAVPDNYDPQTRRFTLSDPAWQYSPEAGQFYETANSTLHAAPPAGVDTSQLLTTHTEYTDTGLTRTVTAPTGVSTIYEQDAAGRLVWQTNPDSSVQTFQFDVAGNLTAQKHEDATSGTRQQKYQYDGLGRRMETAIVMDADPMHDLVQQTRYAYDTTLVPNSTTDPTDVIFPAVEAAVTNWVRRNDLTGDTPLTVTSFDTAGHVLRVRQPDPGPGANGTGGASDHNPPITDFVYEYNNGQGERKLTRILDSGGLNRQSFTEANVLGWTLGVSAQHEKHNPNTSDPPTLEWVETLFNQFDAAGRVVRTYDASGQGRRMEFDKATGLPVEVYTGHAAGNFAPVVHTSQPTNSQGASHTSTVYDSAGNPVQTTGPLENAAGHRQDVTTLTWDGLGRKLSEEITIDEFDDNGGLTGQPSDVTRTWTYNGLTTTYKDRNDRHVVTTVDPVARTVVETWYDDNQTVGADPPQQTITTHANAFGQPVSVGTQVAGATDPASSVTFEYDPAGRATQTSLDGVFADTDGLQTWLDFDCYPGGQRKSLSVHVGHETDVDVLFSETAYDIDDLGRTSVISQDIKQANHALWQTPTAAADKRIEYRYHADNQRESVIRYDTSSAPTAELRGVTDYDYKIDGRFSRLYHFQGFSASPIARHERELNNRSQPTSETRKFFDSAGTANAPLHDETQTWDFDAVGRYIENNGTATPRDAAGNRTGGGREVGRFSRLLADGGYEYVYDAEGNVIERRGRAARVVDNFDGSGTTNVNYDETGIWHSEGGGLGGQQRVSNYWSSVATFDVDVDGTEDAYELWLTWDPNLPSGETPGSGTVEIWKDTSATGTDTLLHSEIINFANPPSGITDSDSVAWQLLNVYGVQDPDDLYVKIRQVDTANPQWIVADALRAVPADRHQTFEYDHRNRLTAVTALDAFGAIRHREEYGYDGLGRHVATAVYESTGAYQSGQPDAWSWHVLDGTRRLVDLNAQGYVSTAYLNGPAANEVLAIDVTETGATTSVWAFTDLRGSFSSLATVDAAGWHVLHRDFDDHGRIEQEFTSAWVQALDASPVMWRGLWFNADVDQPLGLSTTGMPYDPRSQRWLSPRDGDNGYAAFTNPHTANVAPGEHVDPDVYSGPWIVGALRHGIGETYRSVLGDEFLVGASDGTTYALAIIPSMAGGLAAGVALPLLGFEAAAGVNVGNTVAVVGAGAAGGFGEYAALYATAAIVDTFNGGGYTLNAPRLSDAAEFTVFGGLSGGLGFVGGAALRPVARGLASAGRAALRPVGRGFVSAGGAAFRTLPQAAQKTGRSAMLSTALAINTARFSTTVGSSQIAVAFARPSVIMAGARVAGRRALRKAARIGQYAGGLDEASVLSRFDEVASFRRNSPNLPDILTGNRSVDDVALMIETSSGKFFGENGWIGRSDVSYRDVLKAMKRRGMKPNAQTPTHAEGGAAWKILMDDTVERGLGTFLPRQVRRGNARVFVDATFCRSCGELRGLENLLRGLGFDSADAFIRLPNGHIVSGRMF